jgi:hypothetical protein
MIYGGPDFLTFMIRLLPTPYPLSRLQVVSFSQSSCVSPVELTDERGCGGGAKSYAARKPRECSHLLFIHYSYALCGVAVNPLQKNIRIVHHFATYASNARE